MDSASSSSSYSSDMPFRASGSEGKQTNNFLPASKRNIRLITMLALGVDEFF